MHCIETAPKSSVLYEKIKIDKVHLSLVDFLYIKVHRFCILRVLQDKVDMSF